MYKSVLVLGFLLYRDCFPPCNQSNPWQDWKLTWQIPNFLWYKKLVSCLQILYVDAFWDMFGSYSCCQVPKYYEKLSRLYQSKRVFISLFAHFNCSVTFLQVFPTQLSLMTHQSALAILFSLQLTESLCLHDLCRLYPLSPGTAWNKRLARLTARQAIWWSLALGPWLDGHREIFFFPSRILCLVVCEI